MRILNRADFLKQPEGVLFAKYTHIGQFDLLCVKHDTISGIEGQGTGFHYQDSMLISADNTEEWLDTLDKAMRGASFNLDLKCGSYDVSDGDQLFIVFEKADLEAYRALLDACVPAVFEDKASH